jgi:hypothetical protein
MTAYMMRPNSLLTSINTGAKCRCIVHTLMVPLSYADVDMFTLRCYTSVLNLQSIYLQFLLLAARLLNKCCEFLTHAVYMWCMMDHNDARSTHSVVLHTLLAALGVKTSSLLMNFLLMSVSTQILRRVNYK